MLRAVVEHAPIAMLVAADGRIVLANSRLERLFGYDADELIGAAVEILVPQRSRRRHRQLRASFVKHGSATPMGAVRELAGVHKTEGLIAVEIHLAAVVVLGRKLTVASIVDLAERRELEAAIAAAAAEEQRRLAADVHDSLGQELTGIALRLQAAANHPPRSAAALAREFAVLNGLVRQAIQTTRDLVRGLAPLGLTDGGLTGALRALAASLSRGAGVPVRFRSRGTRGHHFSDDTAIHLYRIAQEAVTNALKHARAHTVEVELVVTRQQVRLTVADDGRGFRAVPGTAGLGLRTMKFRAGAIGATLSVERRRARGTRVSCVQFKTRPA